MRLGQKNGRVRQWAKRRTRHRQPADQRYESIYIFGAICPARNAGVALALPKANTDAIQRHIEEIARHVSKGAVAVVAMMGRTAWNTTKEAQLAGQYPPAVYSARISRTQPGRENLAVSAPSVSFEPCLSNLR